jgi:hypothetical protein
MTPTPPNQDLSGPVADVVAALGALRSAPAPAAGPALQALFASAAIVTNPPSSTTPRRTPVSTAKRLLATVPPKIAAGVVGALFAGSIGAGALTGTLQLTSNDAGTTSVVPLETTTAVAPEAPEAPDDAADVATADAVDPADTADTATDAPKTAGDPTTAPVPTTVDEAAHNHQFDAACGNHGAYVSAFARTGAEPDCATAARAAAPTTAASSDATTNAAPSDTTATADQSATVAGHGKSAGHGNRSGAGGKGKNRK